MRKLLSNLLLVLGVCTAVSCSKDADNYIPSYITDFLLAYTNGDSMITKVAMDDGDDYVFKSPRIKANVADTVIRCLATYTKDDGEYSFYSISPVVSTIPQYADSLKTKYKVLPHDPVKVMSMWRGRDFMNIKLGVMTTNRGTHKYAFSIDSIRGGTEYVSLIHQRPEEDIEGFTRVVYASLPMIKANENVRRIVLNINTYDGWKSYE